MGLRFGGIRGGLAAIAVVMGLVLGGPKAFAALQIDITQGNIDPLPIAVVDFLGPGSQERQIGVDVAKVIGADLERSGLFRPLPSASYIERIQDVNVQPRFGDWRVISAQALVTGQTVV